jgi:hypothetical protein
MPESSRFTRGFFAATTEISTIELCTVVKGDHGTPSDLDGSRGADTLEQWRCFSSHELYFSTVYRFSRDRFAAARIASVFFLSLLGPVPSIPSNLGISGHPL